MRGKLFFLFLWVVYKRMNTFYYRHCFTMHQLHDKKYFTLYGLFLQHTVVALMDVSTDKLVCRARNDRSCWK